ncbi:MAG: HAD hydrolase family protein, partial [Oscillospiraceae bacterium]
MKTLYVSDLDGTLLTSEKKLTKATIELLNKSIAEGAQFAIATARMPYACDYRMKEINLNIPSILTNGVFLYDFSKGKYVS